MLLFILVRLQPQRSCTTLVLTWFEWNNVTVWWFYAVLLFLHFIVFVNLKQLMCVVFCWQRTRDWTRVLAWGQNVKRLFVTNPTARTVANVFRLTRNITSASVRLTSTGWTVKRKKWVSASSFYFYFSCCLHFDALDHAFHVKIQLLWILVWLYFRVQLIVLFNSNVSFAKAIMTYEVRFIKGIKFILTYLHN